MNKKDAYKEIDTLGYECIENISRSFESIEIEEDLISKSGDVNDSKFNKFKLDLEHAINESNSITSKCYEQAKKICDVIFITDDIYEDRLDCLTPIKINSVIKQLLVGLEKDIASYKKYNDDSLISKFIQFYAIKSIKNRLKDVVLGIEYKYIDAVKGAIYPILHDLKGNTN